MGLGVDHRSVFNPADLVLTRLDSKKAPAMLQDFERLPVYHLAHAVGNRGDAIVQVRFANGNVNRFMLFVPESRTSRQEDETAQRYRRQRKQEWGAPEKRNRKN
ncbi:MAG: hypothetical protein ABSC62_06700 [Terracidiphilus sp.]